jgi:poly(A) polymerase
VENTNNNHHALNRIQASEHRIDESKICGQARHVVETLLKAGYEAYLVGGCVRDLVLGIEPKDFDVATNAHPEQICEHFDNSRLIGRRFRIVHVYYYRNNIEVSTFRAKASQANNPSSSAGANGRILRDNTFGTIEEDAIRRDFTINALYYDIENSEVLDYCNGYQDLQARKIRMIGDAETRYKEDPVRMLRALRFRAKLDLTIEDETKSPIKSMGQLLSGIPPARLFDEVIKLFHSGYAVRCFQELENFRLLQVLFPITYKALNHDESFSLLIHNALENTDTRIRSGKSVNPAFIFAILLWRPYLQLLEQSNQKGIPYSEGSWSSGRRTVLDQSKVISIPKRFSVTICEIWKLQNRFQKKHGRKSLQLMSHPRFRAAYDFMCLRAHSGELDEQDCTWWTQIQTVSEQEQHKMVDQNKRKSGTKKNKQ